MRDAVRVTRYALRGTRYALRVTLGAFDPVVSCLARITHLSLHWVVSWLGGELVGWVVVTFST